MSVRSMANAIVAQLQLLYAIITLTKQAHSLFKICELWTARISVPATRPTFSSYNNAKKCGAYLSLLNEMT